MHQQQVDRRHWLRIGLASTQGQLTAARWTELNGAVYEGIGWRTRVTIGA